MTDEQIERGLGALESLADAFQQIAKLQQVRFEKEYPVRVHAEPFVGVAKYETPETDKPEERGDLFPEEIGPREAKLLAIRRKKQAARGA